VDRVAGQRRPLDGPGLVEAAAGDLVHATETQKRTIKALISHGNIVDAAASLDLTPEQFRRHLREAQRRNARRGNAPEYDNIRDAPPGFHLRGTSTLYGADGQPKLQWVKTAKDAESRLEALLEAVQDMAEPLRGIVDPIPFGGATRDDLRVCYPFGDPHVGLYSWHEETGQNFDLDIAEANLTSAVSKLVALAPPSRVGHLINLGDFFHSDNKANTTTRGTPVDVDGRYARVQRVGARIIRRAIDLALTKHDEVLVTNVIGNHDEHTAQTLSLCLEMLYENEPRVTIDTSPAKFHYYRFGKNMYGVTHGDTAKPKDLESIMATDRSKDWGETRYRHWYTGHVHHDSLKEFRGCTVETFRTLAARDAWHHSMGYRADRDMKADVWHVEFGRITRHIVGIEQIASAGA